VAERCLELANRLFKSSGSLGIFKEHPFGRFYNDMIAVRQHVAAQSQVTARSIGAQGFGLDIDEWYL
jgi:3-hydroxy-9,10-secoandrosta-1,3,5(10)-triene-9,17-dione monooxygenase